MSSFVLLKNEKQLSDLMFRRKQFSRVKGE
jgi:hypothetical protein